MDRLLSLKKSDGKSAALNTSISSELGYETANDDSFASLYYSINEDSDDSSPNSPSHQQDATIVPDADSSNQTDQSTECSPTASIGTESATQFSIAEPIELMDQPISSANSDVVVADIETGPAVSSTNGDSHDHEMDTIGRDAMTAAQNLIFSLPSGLPSVAAISSTNMTNIADSSSVVQELYVVAVAQQRTSRAPELNRGMKNQTKFDVLECNFDRQSFQLPDAQQSGFRTAKCHVGMN